MITPPGVNNSFFNVMATTYLTKAQREVLINSYIDCMEDMGEEDEIIEDRKLFLQSLNNKKLIDNCVAFMPDCMEEL